MLSIYQYYRFLLYLIFACTLCFFNCRILKNKIDDTFQLFISKVLSFLIGIFASVYIMVCFLDTPEHLAGKVQSSYPLIVLGGGMLKELIILAVMLSLLLAVVDAVCILAVYFFVDRLKKYKYESIFLFVCLLELFNQLHLNIGAWYSAWYAMDYSMGFGSRMFIGSVMSLFYDDFLSHRVAKLFVYIALLILGVLIAFMLGGCIRKAQKDQRLAVLYLALLAVTNPGSYSSIIENFGRFDMYGYIVSLLVILWCVKIKNVISKYVGIIILSVVIILIHQGNLFLCFPILFCTILCSCYRDGKWRKKELVLGGGVCVIIFFSFVAIQLFGTSFAGSEDALVKYLEARTDIPIIRDALHFEYFASIGEAYNAINKWFLLSQQGNELPWLKLALTLVLLAPLLLVIGAFWKELWLKEQRIWRNTWKNPITYILISFLSIVPQFILNVDWGRWFGAIFFVQFTVIFYLIFSKKFSVNDILFKFSKLIKDHYLIAACIPVYLMLLDKFTDRAFLDQVNTMMYIFDKLAL